MGDVKIDKHMSIQMSKSNDTADYCNHFTTLFYIIYSLPVSDKHQQAAIIGRLSETICIHP